MNWTPDRHSFLRGLVEHMSRTGSCAMCTLRDFAWQCRRMHTRRLAGCCSVAGALRGCVGAWVRAGSLRGIRGDLFHTATLATHFGMQSASWCWCCTRNRRRFGSTSTRSVARIAVCIHSSGINTFVVIRSSASASAAICIISCMPYSSNEITKCRSQANTFGFIGWGVRV